MNRWNKVVSKLFDSPPLSWSEFRHAVVRLSVRPAMCVVIVCVASFLRPSR